MAETGGRFVTSGLNRYDSMPKPLKVIFLVLTTIGLGLFILYMFGFTILGYVLPSAGYYYLLFAAFTFCVFTAMPMRKKDRGRVPWYDIVFAVFMFGFCLFCFLNVGRIVDVGWVPPPSTLTLVLATIFGVLAIEGGRRMGGKAFVILALISWFYPLVAEDMPGILFAASFDFNWTVGWFAFSANGILGLPARLMGEILIGFLLFAGVLMASGAGKFFLNISLCILGKYRGGPAKVAVLASGFFGSLSGSAVSNVVATGAVTIPTMKRIGYPPHYAGAIEACASTGGIIMPPVMGAIAFIMAEITGIEYAEILIAAFIPASLYYFGLLLQVDAYAGRVGLKGLPREDIPSMKQTLKEGWPFIAVLAFLVFGLLYMRWSVLTPIYAAGLLFVLSFTSKRTMMTPRRIVETIAMVGSLITNVMAIMIPVGFIIAGLRMTGLAGGLISEIVNLSQGNILPVIFLGIGICYVMGLFGMGMLAYIFLAVTMAPAILSISNLDVIAVHLFIVIYGIVGMVTPPIGVCSFVGAAMAGAPPMKTLVTSMRLAVVLLFIPFFFLFNPALVLRGDSVWTIAYLLPLSLVGIAILCGGLEGYLLKLGRLDLWARVLLVIGGFLISFPGYEQITWWMTSIIGAGLTLLVIVLMWIQRKTTVKLITSE